MANCALRTVERENVAARGIGGNQEHAFGSGDGAVFERQAQRGLRGCQPDERVPVGPGQEELVGLRFDENHVAGDGQWIIQRRKSDREQPAGGRVEQQRISRWAKGCDEARLDLGRAVEAREAENRALAPDVGKVDQIARRLSHRADVVTERPGIFDCVGGVSPLGCADIFDRRPTGHTAWSAPGATRNSRHRRPPARRCRG